MSEVIDVPFSIRVTGDSTDQLWTGDFRTRVRLSHSLNLKKDRLRRELLGTEAGTPTERAMSTAMILSELSVRLTKTPKWWDESNGGLDLEDDNLIGSIYDLAMAPEREALEAKRKKALEAQEAMRKDAEKAADSVPPPLTEAPPGSPA